MLGNPNIDHVPLVEAADHVRRGNELKVEGRAEEATAAYRAALRIEPAYAEAHNNLGELLAADGRTRDAELSFQEAVVLNPQYAEAYNNLGKLRNARGDHAGAISAFRLAVEQRPTYPEASIHLAACLAEVGQSEEAAHQLQKAVRSNPDIPEIRAHYIDLVRNVEFSTYDAVQVELLHEFFGAENVDLQELVRPAVSLLKLDHNYGQLVKALQLRVEDGRRWREVSSAATNLCANLLFEDVLIETYVTDIGFEEVLRSLRRLALADLSHLSAADLDLMSLLAVQASNTEYVYSLDPREDQQIAALRTSAEELIGSDEGVLDASAHVILAVLAQYLPLADLTCATQLIRRLGRVNFPFQQVIQRTLLGPRQERARRDALSKSSTTVQARTDVKQQYESNPFPRWLTTRSLPPMSLATFLRLQFPDFTPPPFYNRPCTILIAGCGTGKQAIDVARRHPDSAVTAIDWSVASLAYAERMAERLCVRNIDFRQLDINNVHALDMDFDFVECSGVLHHLPDPEYAWRLLTDMVRVGGVMNIGLYSRTARRSITRLRARNELLGLSGTAREIRAFRAEVMLGELTWARAELEQWRDFFTMSGLRDLIFAAHEDLFDIPRIERALAACNLDFVGFAFRNSVTTDRYRELFPADKTMQDLSLWHAFEATFPDTFTDMYQIYCQKSN